MARTKHTDPQDVIASRRVREPRQSRGQNDVSSSKRIGRILRELGISTISDDTSAATATPTALPRITARKARSGFLHPISKRDIEQILNFFGERTYYGISRIRLSQTSGGANGGMLFGRLHIPGEIVLYEQVIPPWFLSGRLGEEELRSLREAGAEVEHSDDGMRCVVHWSETNLRNFFLFDVLMHEIGHHIQQQFRAKRTAQVLRTQDHERFAKLFASRCRQEFLRDYEDAVDIHA